MSRVYAVIMAGGRGERFWPLSTDQVPKPFIPLLGTSTLLQDTVERLQPLIQSERIFVSLGEVHEAIARRQLPQVPADNFIIEPVGRDTAACLGYCALHLERIDPEGIMFAFPADHYIADRATFQTTLHEGIHSLPGATAVVFGIHPQRPDTGYGYVQAEKPVTRVASWPVIRFVEKPDEATAARYLQAGNYFWNSGIFLWENRTLLKLLAKHMPDTYRGLNELRPLLGRPEAGTDRLHIFSGLRRVSIDYGVLEKTSGLRMVPADFDWDDIGNWSSLARALPTDPGDNVTLGPHFMLDSNRCITYSDAGAVAAFGVHDLVIVQAHGNVLVCSKESAPRLKKLVTAMSETAVKTRPQTPGTEGGNSN